MAERDEQFTELPLDSPGLRLRRAREAAGLTLSDISARTKIAERHLSSIENDAFEALASRAYAVGFTRSYARALSLDEHEYASAVRDEFDRRSLNYERHPSLTFEPGDPARVPTARLAWLSALAAVLVIAVVFALWRNFYSPAVDSGDLAPSAAASAKPVAVAAAGGSQPVAPGPVAGGEVVFTAQDDGVWVKFYDASGAQLFQKEMVKGERFVVPAGANGPMIRTARPEALQITVAGQIVPVLSERQMIIKDVPVSAAALLARPRTVIQPGAAVPAPAQSSTVSR